MTFHKFIFWYGKLNIFFNPKKIKKLALKMVLSKKLKDGKFKIIDELNQSNLFEGPISLKPMTGGTVNRSFKLASKGKAFFLKTFELNHIVPTDRQALFMQQQQLAKYHKAAMPTYLSHNHELNQLAI